MTKIGMQVFAEKNGKYVPKKQMIVVFFLLAFQFTFTLMITNIICMCEWLCGNA